jgi:hypothetical protein
VPLGRGQHAGDAVVLGAAVGTQVDLGRIGQRGRFRQLRFQGVAAGQRTTLGSTGGGGAEADGISRLTECSWMGMVMISITSSTSITSISGVVFISTITSASPSSPVPMCIAMSCS